MLKRELHQEKVSISFKDALIEDIIKEVEVQSGYVVVYNNTLLKNMARVTVRLNNVNAKDALNEALKGSGLECKLVEDFLVISKKDGKDEEQKATFRKIKGKVMDEKGLTLPGVTVLIKGTTLGVVTDIDGKFSLEVPKMDSTILVFSFVGMVSQEYRLSNDPKNDEKEISIRMKEDVKEMQEVVVTGYANINKESFTGNSVTVKREDLLKVSKQTCYRHYRPLILLFVFNKIINGDRTRIMYLNYIFRGQFWYWSEGLVRKE